MPRDAHIEQRLQAWAAAVTLGDGSGYPGTSVLHPGWQPPSPGLTPTLKHCRHTDVRATHRAIARLSLRLRNTVVVHYCLRLSVADQAGRLQCAESTVHSRIDQVHRELSVMLCEEARVGDALQDVMRL